MNWLTRHAARLVGATAAAGLMLTAAAPASAQSAIRDTEIEAIIHEWADPVFLGMGLEPSEVEILLIADPELNAFATRGRIMGINTGLILRTRSPNELLGVIAHEAGHIRNRHTLRDGAQNAGMQPMLMTMALGALAIAAGAPPSASVRNDKSSAMHATSMIHRSTRSCWVSLALPAASALNAMMSALV